MLLLSILLLLLLSWDCSLLTISMSILVSVGWKDAVFDFEFCELRYVMQ